MGFLVFLGIVIAAIVAAVVVSKAKAKARRCPFHGTCVKGSHDITNELLEAHDMDMLLPISAGFKFYNLMCSGNGSMRQWEGCIRYSARTLSNYEMQSCYACGAVIAPGNVCDCQLDNEFPRQEDGFQQPDPYLQPEDSLPQLNPPVYTHPPVYMPPPDPKPKAAIIVLAIALSIVLIACAGAAVWYFASNGNGDMINDDSSRLRESTEPKTPGISAASLPTESVSQATPEPAPAPAPAPDPIHAPDAITPSEPSLPPTADNMQAVYEMMLNTGYWVRITAYWSGGRTTLFERDKDSPVWMMTSRTGDYRLVEPDFSFENNVIDIGFPTTRNVYRLQEGGTGDFGGEALTWEFESGGTGELPAATANQNWKQVYIDVMLEAVNYAQVAQWDTHDPDGKYPKELSVFEIIDLNFDGTPELLIFGDGASVSYEMRVFTLTAEGVERIFIGWGDHHDIHLHRRTGDNSLAFFFTSANSDDGYYGSIFRTDSRTDMGSGFQSAAKIADFSETFYYIYGDGEEDEEYLFDGRAVSQDDYYRLKAGLYAGYEAVERTPTVLFSEITPDSIAALVDSYVPVS